MAPGLSAASWAQQQVTSVRDDPSGRLALMERCYHGPFGEAPRHLPYRRAAVSFMRWQLRRGVLQPQFANRAGSPWWRAVNERIIREGCEAVALSGNLPGPASSPTIDHWMAFVATPTARAWYRAHNGSVVSAYLEHRDLAEAENAAERFFMNVVLCRVLYAHALVSAPALALAWLRPLAPLLGDPRLGMAGIFLQLSRVVPDEYPLRDGVGYYLDDELGFGRLVDYGVISPRLLGVTIAALNAIVQLSYLDHNTFWSFTMIRVDLLVIYALVAHGGRIEDDWRSCETTTVRRARTWSGRELASVRCVCLGLESLEVATNELTDKDARTGDDKWQQLLQARYRDLCHALSQVDLRCTMACGNGPRHRLGALRRGCLVSRMGRVPGLVPVGGEASARGLIASR